MIRQLLLILRFYYSAMFFFCAAVSVALAWLVKVHGPEIIPMCMLCKAAVYPLYLYVWTNSSITAIWASGGANCWA